jgi:drug/metabolite transporter (DMT)-like permease
MGPVNRQSGDALPYLRLAGGQLAIGAAAIFARFALLGAGPIAVSAARMTLAALVLLVFSGGVKPLSMRREIAFVLAGLALAIHFGSWIASLQYTSVAISTLLVTTTPLWTEAYDVVRERRPPSREFLTSLGLGFVGVVLVATQPAPSAPPLPGHVLFGDALALLGSITIGAYFLIVRDAGAEPRGARLPTRTIVVRTYGWAAFALLVAAALAHQDLPAGSNISAWGGIVAMALVSQLLGHTELNAALRYFRPSIVALSTLAEPAVAAVLAALVFHEFLGQATVVGGILVLVAVALALRASKPGTVESLSAEIST